MSEVRKIEDQEIDFEKILESDIKGWMDFFNNPKMPEFIAYIQALHSLSLRKYINNPLITDDDVRKAGQQKGAANHLLLLQNVLIDAMEGLRSQREPKT